MTKKDISIPIEQPLEEEISVFETMRSYGGKIMGFEEHLTRLEESAKTLNLPLSTSREDLKKAIEKELIPFGEKEATIRPTLFRSHIRFIAKPLRELKKEWYEKGVEVTTSPARLPLIQDASSGAKSISYGPQALTHLTHLQHNFEILFLDAEGFVGELRINNIFLVKDNVLKTPPAIHILNGVTRRVMLKLARSIPIEVEEFPLTRHDFYNADECFLTNSVVEALPIRCLDGRVIGSGRPGPVTKKLRELYQKEPKNP